MTGKLSLVATPIGNLEDITLRALRTLREASCVLAEDTRHTRGLLTHHQISTRLASLHAHTDAERIAVLADELAAGAHYALVTDAGTPLVSDPGGELVRAAVERGVQIEAIPGPSAVISALCVAGLPVEHFRFVGFLPRGGKRRREAISGIARDRLTSVLFEAPSRLSETLKDLREECGAQRRAAVCRELTKLHEEVARGTLAELEAKFAEGARGELTLVVEGAREEEVVAVSEAPVVIDERTFVSERLGRGLGVREVAKELSSALGIDRREAYQRVLALKTSP